MNNFPDKHCEAQPDSGGSKGGELHVLHPYLLSQARLTQAPICLTLLNPHIWVQGGFVPNKTGFLLSRVQPTRCVGVFVNENLLFCKVVKLESCLFRGRHCEYLPPCYKSSCLQLFSPFPVITVDPDQPDQPPAISLIPLPSACSCLVLY